MTVDLIRRAGTGGEVTNIRPEDAGWAKSSLRVVDLPAGGDLAFDTDADEIVIVPLSGQATVEAEDAGAPGEGEPSGAGRVELTGRTGVFEGVTDVVYVPRDSQVRLHTEGGGRFAVCGARAETRFPFQYIAASSVPVELRGAGQASRQVNNLGLTGVLDADRILVCEVLTPAGNWSSYPPHKHDHESDRESVLEEIYYFEVGPGPDGTPGMAYQRVYASDDRPIDVLAEVRSGDAVLVPYGWHGPSMAVPGYDLYYLNVMAGPGERVWRVCDDPAHGWVRGTWPAEAVDPRLPMTTAPEERQGSTAQAERQGSTAQAERQGSTAQREESV